MMDTKQRYGKLGSNVDDHGYHNFKTGEVTSEEANEIGLDTARWMWDSDYEIVFTTHLNTDNLHNHIEVNSVSSEQVENLNTTDLPITDSGRFSTNKSFCERI